MKKPRAKKGASGLTIVELVISMAIIGVIFAATASIFSTAVKNYRVNFQKSVIQKELNFTLDSIANDIKSAATVNGSFCGFTTNENTLILGIPAINEDNDFIYTGDVLELDHIIYFKTGNTIKKHICANILGKKASLDGKETMLINNVSDFSIEYSPGIVGAEQIRLEMGIEKPADKTTIRITGQRTANLRNAE